MNRWRNWHDLSWADRGVLLQAAVLLIHARFALRFIEFRADPVPAVNEAHPSMPAAASLLRAQAVARLVGVAAAHSPVSIVCLHRSLVLWRLLRHKGIPCSLRLGAVAGVGPFEAHAWVECAGVALNEGAESLARYRPFGRAVVPVAGRPLLRRLGWRAL